MNNLCEQENLFWERFLKTSTTNKCISPMMFFRANVVPILAKSASALPGSCSSAKKEIMD